MSSPIKVISRTFLRRIAYRDPLAPKVTAKKLASWVQTKMKAWSSHIAVDKETRRRQFAWFNSTTPKHSNMYTNYSNLVVKTVLKMRQNSLLNLGLLTILAAWVKSVGLELSFATCPPMQRPLALWRISIHLHRLTKRYRLIKCMVAFLTISPT